MLRRDVGEKSTCEHPEDFSLWVRVRGPAIVIANVSAVEPDTSSSSSSKCAWRASFVPPVAGAYEVDAVWTWWQDANPGGGSGEGANTSSLYIYRATRPPSPPGDRRREGRQSGNKQQKQFACEQNGSVRGTGRPIK